MIWDVLQDGADWFALRGEGYQFWSGIGSGSPLFIGVLLLYKKHNCHISGCPRLAWHPHPEHGHPVCRHHHPDVL